VFRVPAIALRAAVGDGVAELLLTGQRVRPRRLLEEGFAFEFPRLDEALKDLK
jgi:NAD dependent epimerase/dehydratase family enzyme